MVARPRRQGQPVVMYFLMEEHNITQEGIIAKTPTKPETDEAFISNYQYIDNSGDGRTYNKNSQSAKIRIRNLNKCFYNSTRNFKGKQE